MRKPLMNFVFLLGAIFALVLASPFLEGDYNFVLILLFIGIVATALNAARLKGLHLRVGLFFAFLWLAISLIDFLQVGAFSNFMGLENPPRVLSLFFFLVLLFFTAGSIISFILSSRKVGPNVIAGGVSVFFLIGLGWASVYALVENIAPGSLDFGSQETTLTFSRYIYFSFTTLTTLGYGDIHPVSPFASILTILEASMGLLYIGVFIARLIGQFRN